MSCALEDFLAHVFLITNRTKNWITVDIIFSEFTSKSEEELFMTSMQSELFILTHSFVSMLFILCALYFMCKYVGYSFQDVAFLSPHPSLLLSPAE